MINNMSKVYLAIAFTFFGIIAFAQNPNKKTLEHPELVSWNRIEQNQISNDGKWVAYQLVAEEGDHLLYLWNASTKSSIAVERGSKPIFTADNSHLIAVVSPHQDSIKNMKRRKVKKEDFPRDTLLIYDLKTGSRELIPKVSKHQVPEKWGGWIFYQMEAEKPPKDTTEKDTTSVVKESLEEGSKEVKKKPKKEGKDTGYKLVVRSLADTSTWIFPFVSQFVLAEEGAVMVAYSTGDDAEWSAGVYRFEAKDREVKRLWEQKEQVSKLVIDHLGNQLLATARMDTIKASFPPLGLYYWSADADSVRCRVTNTSAELPPDWILSGDAAPSFSKDGSRMFIPAQPKPIERDTMLLDEEVSMVEVWHWQDGLLHTQQKVRAEQERKRVYQFYWNTQSDSLLLLNDPDLPEIGFGNEKNADYTLLYTDRPYQKVNSWELSGARDVYLKNLQNGEIHPVGLGITGNVEFSPSAKYLYWYSRPDSTWFVFDVVSKVNITLKLPEQISFYDEEFDMPDHPYTYGIAGWSQDDQWLYLYDRYDIWQLDPLGRQEPKRLTNGRSSTTTYRYISLDREQRYLPTGNSTQWLLRTFNEQTKYGGYASMSLSSGMVMQLLEGPYQFSRSPQKANNSDKLIYTRSNFLEFPDLLLSDLTFKSNTKVSNANPQQKDYSWGNVELYEWISLDGIKLRGLLYKPENFDPNRKYPMIVNFYEKNSDNLYRHHAPSPGRSTINYAFYVSRGYLIFVPDIPYRDGYPGESAYNAILPGVTSLIEKGFVDRDRIGVQGHSWGGYQIAYLLTRTNIFKCAESGAPVVNMTSAYGGIRWETGLSRMFQYERTQSRIGGTLWEYPLRYLENSPLFTLDKVETPVLIMHNDKDGHVPWYQGIEYFVALRRLGKPSWLLNYNDEPHWPLKLENRKDFNIRMQQFFDHYLMNEPMPMWMDRGVPATDKGIQQGYELMRE